MNIQRSAPTDKYGPKGTRSERALGPRSNIPTPKTDPTSDAAATVKENPLPKAKADFKRKLRDVPHKPGVYLMRDRLNRIIYVGKAKSLRKRLSSYFMPSRRQTADMKTRSLIESIWDFEFAHGQERAGIPPARKPSHQGIPAALQHFPA